jgi:DNA-binding response OmpR family regulator
MSERKILIVEDDPTLLSVLEYNLRKEGYQVVTATDGIRALEVARGVKPDFIILDVMLPKMSGFEVCRVLRNEMTVPILMLTAREDEIDKVVGLDLGADDYMTKPFKMRELLARIRAIGRRTSPSDAPQNIPEPLLKMKDIEIDIARHKATLNGSELNLTLKEFDLLTFLVKNKGLVVTREQLIDKVWGYDYAGDTRTIDVHIQWLRAKIEENPKTPKRLLTVRGLGYKLEE